MTEGSGSLNIFMTERSGFGIQIRVFLDPDPVKNKSWIRIWFVLRGYIRIWNRSISDRICNPESKPYGRNGWYFDLTGISKTNKFPNDPIPSSLM